MEPSSSAAIARLAWEQENSIPAAASDPYADESSQTRAQQEKPWANDLHHFRRAKISALALLKMVVHARAGGTIEVMGLMQGKCEGDAIIVMDASSLPVEGTETRVNAQADAYEYMVEYSTINKQAGRLENVVGWYCSLPGRLSGIDVSSEMLNQKFTEPFLSVVIDPTRTVSAGKVEIGAFITYPKDYKPPDEPVSEYQTIPVKRVDDFGVHCKQYYSLDVTYFKSSLDSHLLDELWNKYWVSTLSSSPLLGSRDYFAGQHFDLADKLEQAEGQLGHCRFGDMPMPSQRKNEREESPLAKVTRDDSKIIDCDMSRHWEALDHEIKATNMPPVYPHQNVVTSGPASSVELPLSRPGLSVPTPLPVLPRRSSARLAAAAAARQNAPGRRVRAPRSSQKCPERHNGVEAMVDDGKENRRRKKAVVTSPVEGGRFSKPTPERRNGAEAVVDDGKENQRRKKAAVATSPKEGRRTKCSGIVWDNSLTSMFCTCYLDLMKSFRDDNKPTNSALFEIIAEEISAKTGKTIKLQQLRSRFSKLQGMYRIYIDMQDPAKDKRLEKNKERGVEFQDLLDGKLPPYFELVKMMFDTKDQSASKAEETTYNVEEKMLVKEKRSILIKKTESACTFVCEGMSLAKTVIDNIKEKKFANEKDTLELLKMKNNLEEEIDKLNLQYEQARERAREKKLKDVLIKEEKARTLKAGNEMLRNQIMELMAERTQRSERELLISSPQARVTLSAHPQKNKKRDHFGHSHMQTPCHSVKHSSVVPHKNFGRNRHGLTPPGHLQLHEANLRRIKDLNLNV